MSRRVNHRGLWLARSLGVELSRISGGNKVRQWLADVGGVGRAGEVFSFSHWSTPTPSAQVPLTTLAEHCFEFLPDGRSNKSGSYWFATQATHVMERWEGGVIISNTHSKSITHYTFFCKHMANWVHKKEKHLKMKISTSKALTTRFWNLST